MRIDFKTACAAGNQLIALQARQLVDLTALIAVQFRAAQWFDRALRVSGF